MSVSQQETTTDRPEPSTLVEALAGFNMTVDHALGLARRCRDGYDGGDYEYDQGDVVVMDFDDLHNLARVALASMSLASYASENGYEFIGLSNRVASAPSTSKDTEHE